MKRAYSELLAKYLKYFPCVALIGVRQGGKTTFLKELPPGWKVFDLEKQSDFQTVSADPDVFFRLNEDKVAIDEVQFVPALFPALRVAIDRDRARAGRFVITGSSSPALLGAVSESLAGRVGIIEMAPLTCREAFEVAPGPLYEWFASPGSSFQPSALNDSMIGIKDVHRYWFYGGYPEPWVKKEPGFHKAWMENYVQTYLHRDVAGLFPRINRERFRRFLHLLGGFSGAIVNFAEVARALGVSQPTAQDYFEIADGTFLWRNVQSFEKRVLKRVVRHPRGYLRDSGLLHHLLRVAGEDDLDAHPFCGRSWEGMAIEQIIRGLNARGVGFNYSYYRTAGGAEVDLVLEGDFGLVAVEVKHSQAAGANDLRTLKAFVAEHDCRLGIVVNNDETARLFDERIAGVPMGCL
ncbi:MAG: ATP-binding protein [Deltaproteobacteria bacterium]|nr:ATP-binding protein [Deltaproteobacteria bacterium]